MALDQRSTILLNELVHASSHLSINELMEKFNVSRRTIYYDIEKINDWLEDNNLDPVRYIRSVGFYLEENTKKHIPEKIETIKKWHYEFSADERKAWLAVHLLIRESPLFLEDLIDKLLVSRNTVIADIKKLKSDLSSFDLTLFSDRKRGYVINGSEINKRKSLVYYLSHAIPEQGWQSLIADIQMFLQENPDGEAEWPVNLFKVDELKAVYDIISDSEQELRIEFTDDVLHSLAVRFLLFSKRLMQGKQTSVDPVEKDVLRQTKEYKAAERMGKKLERLFQITFPEDEIFYITTHLLSARVNYDERAFPEYNDMQKLKSAATKMVTDFQNLAIVSFQDRDLAERNLLTHLKPAYYRLKYDLEVHNQLTDSVKRKYPEVFLLTKKVMHHLEKAVGKPVNDHEVAFIAMHFGGWMKREGAKPASRKRVLLVCANGIGTSRLLRHQLEGMFSTVDIVQSVSLREYEKNNFDVDFVISTTPIAAPGHPVFLVSPILTESEKEVLLNKVNALDETSIQKEHSLEQLMNIVGKYTTVHHYQELFQELKQYLNQPNITFKQWKPTLSELISSRIQLKEKVDSWEEAIKIAANPLLDYGFISKTYVEAMISNVYKIGTYIIVAPEVAIPHAKPEDGVKKLGMSVLRLDKGVSFSNTGEKEVKLFIVLAAIDDEKHLKALSQLTTMMTDQENIKKLKAADSAEKMMEIIDYYAK